MPASAAARTAAAARRARVLGLRLEGLSFEQIGAQLDPPVSRQRAYRLYADALRQVVREPASELLTADLERLNLLWGAMLARALAGSARHAEVALKVLERRARMFGLDAADRLGDRAVSALEEAMALAAPLLADVLVRVLAQLGLDADAQARALELARQELRKIEAGDDDGARAGLRLVP